MGHRLLVGAFNGNAVAGENNVPRPDVGLACRRVGRDVGDLDPDVRRIRLQPRLDGDAGPAADDVALGDKLLGDAAGQIPGYRSAQIEDTDLIDADHLAPLIDEGSAAVPAENARVMENPADEGADVFSPKDHLSGRLLGK